MSGLQKASLSLLTSRCPGKKRRKTFCRVQTARRTTQDDAWDVAQLHLNCKSSDAFLNTIVAGELQQSWTKKKRLIQKIRRLSKGRLLKQLWLDFVQSASSISLSASLSEIHAGIFCFLNVLTPKESSCGSSMVLNFRPLLLFNSFPIWMRAVDQSSIRRYQVDTAKLAPLRLSW